MLHNYKFVLTFILRQSNYILTLILTLSMCRSWIGKSGRDDDEGKPIQVMGSHVENNAVLNNNQEVR